VSRRPAVVLVGALALAITACEGRDAPSAPPAPAATVPAAAAATPSAAPAGASAAAEAEAKQVFESRCVTCHGPLGAGDGPASAGLTPRPRNLRDPAWQASVSDAHIEQIIQYGGAAVGKSPAMPANPDLMARPEVVAALRATIRGLAKP